MMNRQNTRKRQRPSSATAKRRSLEVDWDESEGSSSEDEQKQPQVNEEETPIRETVQEKRARIAREVLDKVSETVQRGEDLDDEEDLVNKTLNENLLQSKGRLRRPVADKLDVSNAKVQVCANGHRLSITSVALSEAEDFAFTGSKDCSIIRWDVETGKRLKRYPFGKDKGHTDQVLALSLSSDGRYLASGGKDKLVRLWDVRSDSLIDSFKGHRDAVTGLVFQKGSHMLYSASSDRSVRAWNINEMAFIESLYGHQSDITSIDSMYMERAVTCSMDRTVRIWRIAEEKQYMLQGAHSLSLDCIRMMDEVHFITGSQESSLALWHNSKKKPWSVIRNAHANKSWIASLACLRNSNLFVSGASDGFIKFWKVDYERRQIVSPCIGQIEIPGYVNGLAFGPSGRVLIAGMGQEHRLGRWEPIKTGKNKLHIIRLPEMEN